MSFPRVLGRRGGAEEREREAQQLGLGSSAHAPSTPPFLALPCNPPSPSWGGKIVLRAHDGPPDPVVVMVMALGVRMRCGEARRTAFAHGGT